MFANRVCRSGEKFGPVNSEYTPACRRRLRAIENVSPVAVAPSRCWRPPPSSAMITPPYGEPAMLSGPSTRLSRLRPGG